jgi:uncharacterized cofD-like protein
VSLTGGGPGVVGIGGGHGLAATLRAARRYAGELCAIVSVADDGGSSGRLRRAFGIPAPGDLRRCLVALAEDSEGVWARAFDHRFESGDLSGHALGNVIIAGLAAVTGSFGGALNEAAGLVGAVGRVYPATAEPVVLKAMVGDREIEGQVAMDRAGPLSSVSIVPADAAPPAAALAALAAADQIIIGPGSLFTSVVAVLAVQAVRDAIEASAGRTIYVANLRATAETAGFDVAAHVAVLEAHGVKPDVVVADPSAIALGSVAAPVVIGALARADGLGHDPALLAPVLLDIHHRRRG